MASRAGSIVSETSLPTAKDDFGANIGSFSTHTHYMYEVLTSVGTKGSMDRELGGYLAQLVLLSQDWVFSAYVQ